MSSTPLPDLLSDVTADTRALVRTVGTLQQQLIKLERDASSDQARLLLEFIDVLDSFDRTLAVIEPKLAEAEPRARKWVASFGSVRRILFNHLSEHGVSRIETVGHLVAPLLHNVTETRWEPGVDEGTILQELMTGYTWRESVLRPAQVVVASNDAKP